MSFVEDKVSQFGEFVGGGLTGESAAEASKEAARIQSQGAQQGIEALREALGPLAGTLEQTLPALLGFTLDPSQQAQFAAENPLLRQLQEGISREVGRTTTQAQAARGKLGSGETQQRLQEQLSTSLIPVTLNEVQRRQNQLLGLTQLGAGAAQTQGVGISDLMGSGAAARAAGTVGAANARQQGFENLLNIGGTSAMLLSDKRTKENIVQMSELEDGIGVYMYNYIGSDETHLGVIAQEVEEIYPDAVNEIDGIKIVNYEVLLNGNQSIDRIANASA